MRGKQAIIVITFLVLLPVSGLFSSPDQHATLGVNILSTTTNAGEEFDLGDVDTGVIVSHVAKNGPAEVAGLLRGDVVTGLNDHTIEEPEDLEEVVRNAVFGEEFRLVVIRGGEVLKLKGVFEHWTPPTTTVIVVHPDSDMSTVSIRPYPRGSIRIPSSLTDEYDALRAKAENGNGEAAYVLFQALDGCKSMFSKEAQLEAAIEQLYQTRTHPQADSDIVVHVSPSNTLADYETFLRESFDRCRDITDEQKGESDAWLKLAVENGHVPAMRAYGYKLYSAQVRGGSDTRAEQAKAYEEAWLQGDINAASSLAEIYGDRSPGTETDKIKAYAYQFVATKLYQSIYSHAGECRLVPELVESYDYALEGRSVWLNSQELQDAQQLAKEILNTNQNCCFK